MKRIAALILVGGVFGIPSLPSHAGTFEDETRKMDQAFTMQDQLFEAEKKSQDAAYAAYSAKIDKAWKRYTAEIEAVWGADSKTPSKKEWVTYSKKRDERSSIDFEQGKIRVDVQLRPGESPESEAFKARLKKQLEDLFTDPAQVDPALKVSPPPQSMAFNAPSAAIYPLENQVAFPDGRTVTKENAGLFAGKMVQSHPLQRKEINTPQGKKQVVSISVDLVPDHLKKRARPYIARVKAMAQRFNIPPSLIFGIMQTESYFNPMARSAVPAYGLMQLVPRSGGRDAYEYVFKNDKVVSADYLYNPRNNIELGSAYLKLLQIREMKRIKDAKTRMLCVIAAYNTGGGNVAKAFTGNHNIRRASAIINTMSYEQVYDYLRTHLPYAETQRYVMKVRKHMENFTRLDGV